MLYDQLLLIEADTSKYASLNFSDDITAAYGENPHTLCIKHLQNYLYARLAFTNTIEKIYIDTLSGQEINILIPGGDVIFSWSANAKEVKLTKQINASNSSYSRTDAKAKTTLSYITDSSDRGWIKINCIYKDSNELNIADNSVPVYLGTESDLDSL